MDGSFDQNDVKLGVDEDPKAPIEKPARQRKLRTYLLMIAPAIIGVIGLFVWLHFTAGRVSTDNATVAAARAPISASVRARVVEVRVTENQSVHQGDVLVRLDPTDFQIAVSRAEAQLASARLQVESLRAAYRKALADVRTARTQADYATAELTRQSNLFDAGIVSRQQLEEARNAANIAARTLSASDESLSSTLADLGGAVDMATDKHPLVMQAMAVLEQARSDLANTDIIAPADGIVARVNQIQAGSYAQPAQTLFWLVSGTPWIDAAFKESQLKDLRPGQPVDVHIDAFPDTDFHGHVASFSPGTGSSFAVLPAENATGNWVRVVQRLMVHIDLDAPAKANRLSVGLSAKVTVDTRQDAAGSAPVSSAP
ncbi:HlyD family secretion protein [Hyphomonas chukchiensis]|uniref:HlyD family secretion protein n=1 Tax=Hyphomonas chukchiensis TaxID=1280947 RepID=UPI0030FC64E1